MDFAFLTGAFALFVALLGLVAGCGALGARQ